jgi:hypothetical protein
VVRLAPLLSRQVEVFKSDLISYGVFNGLLRFKYELSRLINEKKAVSDGIDVYIP